MTSHRLKYLINRYLNNTATEEELQEYANWYRQQGTEGMKLFEENDEEQTRQYTNDLFGSIINNIHFIEHEQKLQAGKRRMLYLKIAAAILVVLSGFLVLYNSLKSKPAITMAVNKAAAAVAGEDIVSIRNRSGISTTVYLKDGSVVQLFAGSELRYSASFNATHRKVFLSGKGFFKVAKDTSRPFTVYSHDIATTALGTSFTITAWPGKNDISVSLHTGKVKVQHIANGNGIHIKDLYLAPGQQVTCNIATGSSTFQQPVRALVKNNTSIFGSRTGLAVLFEDEPMVNVLSAIEKGYAVHLQYNKEEISDMIFSGRIKETDSLSQVLKRMAILYNLTIKETGKGFIIQKFH
jgi:transmembrane sensor